MNIPNKTSKFQIHREYLQNNSLHVIHIDENLKHLCRLLESGRTQSKQIREQTQKVLKNNQTIISQNKQTQFLKFIVKNKNSIFQKKQNENTVLKSLIIKQSQPMLKPINNYLSSGRQNKSFSVQQHRRFSTSQQKTNITTQEVVIGPWEENEYC